MGYYARTSPPEREERPRENGELNSDQIKKLYHVYNTPQIINIGGSIF